MLNDANLQTIALERLQALLQEILQCERNYEKQLRRIAIFKKEITKNISEGTSTQGLQTKEGITQQH